MEIFSLLKSIFHNSIPEKYKNEFYHKIGDDVLSRGRALSLTIILLELMMILMISNRSDRNVKAGVIYITMYIIMTAMMLLYLLIYSGLRRRSRVDIKVKEGIIIFYTTFILFWSAAISLLDQLSYEQIIVYLIAIITIAAMSNIKPKILFFMYMTCQLVFVMALPKFQTSESIAYGTIVNSTIMVAVAWVVSVRLYKNKMVDFMNGKIIEEKNDKLNEINGQLTDANSRLYETNVELQAVNQKLKEANDMLELLSITDPVSGLYNRRKFDEALALEWDRRKRYEECMSLVFIDIDYFKSFNDNYGHQSGDLCIKKVSEAIMNVSRRASDIAARFGGEEFVVVLPRLEKEFVYKLAESIRSNVEALNIKHDFSEASDHVTVSIGVYTVVPNHEITISEFIERADKALYSAKQQGRNRVEVYEA